MAKISYICNHHTGGLGNNNYASTANLTVQQINAGHKQRWPTFPGMNGSYVGYNLLVNRDGTWSQHRLVGAETAAQIGHNFDTLSICCIGNFMKYPNGVVVDQPTPEQLATVEKIEKAAIQGIAALEALGIKVAPNTILDITISRIFPHRVLYPGHTSCNGNLLSDDWGRLLALKPESQPIQTVDDAKELMNLWQQVQILMLKINDILAKRKLASQAKSHAKLLGAMGIQGYDCENLPEEIINQ